MVLLVDLPEEGGTILADVGFGNLAPTTALALRPLVEQDTPHEIMLFLPLGDELTLEAKIGGAWAPIAATNPGSAVGNNLIAARPSANRTRLTLFHERLTVRHATGEGERRMLRNAGEYREVLADLFRLELTDAQIGMILDALERKQERGGVLHPYFR